MLSFCFYNNLLYLFFLITKIKIYKINTSKKAGVECCRHFYTLMIIRPKLIYLAYDLGRIYVYTLWSQWQVLLPSHIRLAQSENTLLNSHVYIVFTFKHFSFDLIMLKKTMCSFLSTRSKFRKLWSKIHKTKNIIESINRCDASILPFVMQCHNFKANTLDE